MVVMHEAARRLRAVNNAHTSTHAHALALATLLNHTADAVQAVRAGQSLTAALANCPADARPGTQSLSFHVLRWLGSAQALRVQLAPKNPPPAVDALLLTALALLWPQAEAPYAEHTLVNQAVSAARKRAQPSAAFVNAVLRRFLRERDVLVANALRDPVARLNHPVWWIDRLKIDWPNAWQAILEANNLRPPMTLRVNARRSNASTYVARLAELGMGAQALGTHTVMLTQPCPVTQLPGFEQGDVSVQDAAAQRAADLLVGTPSAARLPAGALVLDACAAPGGKTAHLLELADLEVLALDSDAERLRRVDETLSRLGLSARTLVADASNPQAWWDGRLFDAILLDAPCSAAGVVRRHPDARWLRRATDIAALAALQTRMLHALWPLLKPGGRLLYCACSVFKAEGQAQIDAFLQHQTDARVALSPVSPGHLLPLHENGLNLFVLSTSSAADGFFYALLEKNLNA
jgi:16S rRNA (cytosine967-C5)-methyltransferase